MPETCNDIDSPLRSQVEWFIYCKIKEDTPLYNKLRDKLQFSIAQVHEGVNYNNLGNYTHTDNQYYAAFPLA